MRYIKLLTLFFCFHLIGPAFGDVSNKSLIISHEDFSSIKPSDHYHLGASKEWLENSVAVNKAKSQKPSQKSKNALRAKNYKNNASKRNKEATIRTAFRQSPRIAKFLQKKRQEYAIPDNMPRVGHQYAGTELRRLNGRRALFLTTTALKNEIKEKLYNDVYDPSGKIRETSLKDFSSMKTMQEKVKNWYDNNTDGFTSYCDKVGRFDRAAFAMATITNSNGTGPKQGVSDTEGRLKYVDDRGHLVPEKGVSHNHSTKINGPSNVIPENSVVNQKYKTTFEEFAKNLAKDHHVVTIHKPHYDSPNDFRPTSVTHYLAVNGKILTALTLGNPKD